MSIVEVLLLVMGAGVFIASFALPEKKGSVRQEDAKAIKKEIKVRLEEGLVDIRKQVEDEIEEAISYSVEKTERSLDRLTNEKMEAVHEYSDTVLEDIHKNHKEVAFLYDMLNDKHEKLKSIAASVEMASKAGRKTVTDIENAVRTAENQLLSKNREENMQQMEQPVMNRRTQLNKSAESTPLEEGSQVPTGIEALQQAANEKPLQNKIPFTSLNFKEMGSIELEDEENGLQSLRLLDLEKPTKRTNAAKEQKEKLVKGETGKKAARSTSGKKAGTAEQKMPKKSLAKDAGLMNAGWTAAKTAAEGDSVNSNDIILRMHREGKTKMEIAKQLGLGVGEVKLVIDLFESK